MQWFRGKGACCPERHPDRYTCIFILTPHSFKIMCKIQTDIKHKV